MTSACFSPFRSRRALVATVVDSRIKSEDQSGQIRARTHARHRQERARDLFSLSGESLRGVSWFRSRSRALGGYPPSAHLCSLQGLATLRAGGPSAIILRNIKTREWLASGRENVDEQSLTTISFLSLSDDAPGSGNDLIYRHSEAQPPRMERTHACTSQKVPPRSAQMRIERSGTCTLED